MFHNHTNVPTDLVTGWRKPHVQHLAREHPLFKNSLKPLRVEKPLRKVTLRNKKCKSVQIGVRVNYNKENPLGFTYFSLQMSETFCIIALSHEGFCPTNVPKICSLYTACGDHGAKRHGNSTGHTAIM